MARDKTPNLPQVAGSTAVVPDFDRELEMRLSGVSGGVREEVVKRLRKLAAENPQAFANGMRVLLRDGMSDD